MRKHAWKALAAMCLAASLLGGCGGAVVEEAPATTAASESTETTAAGTTDTAASTEAAGTSASAGGTFTYAIGGDTGNTLNPLTADDRYGLMASKMLYAPLYFINLDGSVDYILAESMESNEDGTVWTCKLKPDLKWSDGEPLTADDVVFTINAHHENNPSLYVNGEPILAEATDETTVTFTLPAPSASAFELLSAELFILPQHFFEPKGTFDVNMLEETPVGAGPYVLDEYMTGQYLSFSKNPNYVLGEANIDNIVYRVIEKDDTATLALQSGEVDAWVASAAEQMLPYQNNENFNIYNYYEGRVAYMMLNSVSENMKDMDYRKGIMHALDRNEIMMAAYSDPELYQLDYTFLPPINEYYTEDVEKYEQDLELAKELTAGGPTELTLLYNVADGVQERMALAIQASLKEIGINVTLNGMEFAAYFNSYMDTTDGSFDLFLNGYVMGIDPNAYSSLFSTEKENYTRCSNTEIDALWTEADMVTDTEARKPLYAEIQKKIQDEAIFYPIGSNYKTLIVNSRIGNVEEAGLVPIYSIKDASKLTINE